MKHFTTIIYMLAMLMIFTHCQDNQLFDEEEEIPGEELPEEGIFNPDFHIYLCFGQSNMEGNADIEEIDKRNIDDRFRVMGVAAEDEEHLGRAAGNWYKAVPPLCRWNTGLTPADYFGRTLVAELPTKIKVGVVVIAMGGSGIDAFDRDNYKNYYENTDAWQKGLMNIYGGNPYAKMVEIGKEAQKSGVIKGILLHQGEINNMQEDWPLKVKKIYENLLSDLTLNADTVPLLAGEMLYENQGGICWGMNSIIRTLPEVIPNAHVISAAGCPGSDEFHFAPEGYRELGKRYANKILSLSQKQEDWPLKKLHIEGRYLKDETGKIVNLHGFAQTYSPFFNQYAWDNYDVEGCLRYNKGLIDKMQAVGWEFDFCRLHMDPYWSNTPGCQGCYEGEECFDEVRFRKYLDEVFIPMAEYMISKGLYVVMRPPGVCPEEIAVGDNYNEYLLQVWGIVSRHSKINSNPHIMFELANEPIDIVGTEGQGKFDNLKLYFQSIVDEIRKNAENIIWVPGLGYQSSFSGLANNPVTGQNIGYAVHLYPGWMGSDGENGDGGSSTGGYEPFQQGWDNQVKPVADFAPIIVTEMDWAPEKYNSSWGKAYTGTVGGPGFGANFKYITDNSGNVSWLIFTDCHLLAQFKNVPGVPGAYTFLNDPEACPWPVYHWLKDYAAGWVTKSPVKELSVEGIGNNELTILTGGNKYIIVKTTYE
ncbi:MAG: cellulase family glycosylhydrolase, partial [Bacteroides sp.]|nr:cellulase family glycosylhydrolase [Bacteroides sp.]